LGRAVEARFEAERDQLPLWLPVGLGSGVAAWFALPSPSAWTGFLLAALAAMVAALTLGWGSRAGKALAIFALAAACGCAMIWAKAERAAAPRLEYPRMAEFAATVESRQRLPAKETIRLVVRPHDPAALAEKLRVNLDADKATDALRPGATVRIRSWLMPPPPMAVPGAYDFARAAWFARIGGTGRAIEVAVVAPATEQSWTARIAGWRERLALHIQSRLPPGGEAGIATALATGDQGAIPEDDAEAMRRSGLAHLLSVSGLHLTAVVGAVMFLTLKLLALSPALALRFRLTLAAAAMGALAGIAYTLLTGAEVPTIRSCVAAILVLAGIAIGRDALTLRLVAVGALVVLLFWPESLAGASFQLSFAAITAIVALHEHPRVKALLSRRDEGTPAKVGRFLLALVLTGVAVEIALMPIALYHFHRSGFYGAAANVVAIPLTTFVIMPLEALALLFDTVGLGAPFWWAAGRILSLLLGLAHAAANAPGAVAMLPTMPTAAFGLMVAGGLWLLLWRTRWRIWGLAPFAAGAVWALATPAPHLLVTGDGRHLALRTPDGGMAILRGRAGDYVRDMLGEAGGSDAELIDLADLPGAACSPDLCAAEIAAGGTRWRLLATRTRNLVDFAPLARACAAADIVVSDRRLPRTCVPRWLKADRALLARTGGLAVTLGERPHVDTVTARVARHPWADPRSLEPLEAEAQHGNRRPAIRWLEPEKSPTAKAPSPRT
jgi:competence protein ComEC